MAIWAINSENSVTGVIFTRPNYIDADASPPQQNILRTHSQTIRFFGIS